MTDSIYKLPKGRSSYEDVMSEVKRLRSEMTSGQKGKLASTSFQGQAEMSKLTHEAFNEFLEWNGLFTFQESSAAKEMPMQLLRHQGSARPSIRQIEPDQV